MKAGKSQAGLAVIEFALLVLTVMLIACGAVNFGLAIRNQQMTNDATMAAALWGANSTYHATLWGGESATGWSGPQSIENVFTAAAASLTNKAVTASTFCTCLPATAVVACSAACFVNGKIDQPMTYVKVVSTVTFASQFNFPGLPTSFTFTSTSVMPLN